MKNSCLVGVLVIVLGTSVALSSISGQARKEGPLKFDEFGYLNHENYSARLDNIAIALQNESTSQGYFLFYNGGKSLPGATLRYMKRLLNYMIGARGIEPSRMILLEGGQRDEITVEFWISPPGSLAPMPNPAASVAPTKTKSYLYDNYSYDCHPLFRPKVKAPYYFDDCGYAGAGLEDQSARLDGFLKAINQTPGTTARIRVNFLARDSYPKVQKFIQQEKNYLLRKGALQASRITVTSRKFSRRSVELWVVPPTGRS